MAKKKATFDKARKLLGQILTAVVLLVLLCIAYAVKAKM